MCEDDIKKLAPENGVERLAVAVGEAFHARISKVGDADLPVGEVEEFGDGFGEVLTQD